MFGKNHRIQCLFCWCCCCCCLFYCCSCWCCLFAKVRENTKHLSTKVMGRCVHAAGCLAAVSPCSTPQKSWFLEIAIRSCSTMMWLCVWHSVRFVCVYIFSHLSLSFSLTSYLSFHKGSVYFWLSWSITSVRSFLFFSFRSVHYLSLLLLFPSLTITVISMAIHSAFFCCGACSVCNPIKFLEFSVFRFRF